MAKKISKAKSTTSAPSKNTFAQSLLTVGSRFSLPKVFDDFLTLSIAACTKDPETGLLHYQEEYAQTFAQYKDAELRQEFCNAFDSLLTEMRERVLDPQGNDILGEFYEQYISKGSKTIFTAFHVCLSTASATGASDTENTKPFTRFRCVLDSACGSGRMLLASHRVNEHNEFYGIDIDQTCVKMAALNLFLNGVWNSEVMCGDSLNSEYFVISYSITSSPLGIFKIKGKKQSLLWQMYRSLFTAPENKKRGGFSTLHPTACNGRLNG